MKGFPEGGCFRVKFGDTVGHLSVGGEHRRIRVAGEVFHFEWHHRFGPCLLTVKGLEKKALPEKHPWWRAVQAWHDQGSRVGDDGFCVWDEPPRRTRWLLKIDRRNYMVVDKDTPGAVEEVED